MTELYVEMVGAKQCQACGKEDSAKPMCFRGEDWCSDTCKKYVTGKIDLEEWRNRMGLNLTV